MADNDFNEDIFNYVVRNEGKRSTVYDDTRNNPTVGIGLNLNDPVTAAMVPLDVRLGKRPMTPQEILSTARRRFDLAVKDARSYVGDKFDYLSPQQQKAIVDMSYNMGLPRLSKFKNMREAVLTADDARAKQELLNSNYANQVPNRAAQNSELISQGTWRR